jgi:hypothetical protein
MEPLSKIRSQLLAYADQQLAYADFRQWIADAYAEHAESGQQSAELHLCRSIEWACAEYSESFVSEDQLRQNLLLIVQPQPVATLRAANVLFLANYDLFLEDLQGPPSASGTFSSSSAQSPAGGELVATA